MVKLIYRRQINPRQYETEECGMEYDVGEEETILDAWADVKGHVLGQLGVPYQLDNEGIIRETRSKAPQMPPEAPFTQPPAPVPPAPVGVPGFPSACQKCGGNDWWDNRQENQERRNDGYGLGPDWKCKNRDCGHPLWPADFEAYKHLPKRPR